MGRVPRDVDILKYWHGPEEDTSKTEKVLLKRDSFTPVTCAAHSPAYSILMIWLCFDLDPFFFYTETIRYNRIISRK